MTTTPTIASAVAAVGYDTTAQKLIVVSGEKRLADVQKDTVIDVGGRQITILELCSSIEEAKLACEERANNIQSLQSLGLSHIAFEQTNEDGSPKVESAEGSLEDPIDDQEELSESVGPFVKHVFNAGCTSEVHEDFQQQLNTANESVRELIGYMMKDIKADIASVLRKQEKLADFIQEKFAISADGMIMPSIIGRVREHNFNILNDTNHLLEENRKRKLPSAFNNISKYTALNKRQRREESGDRVSGEKIGSAGEYMTYPFISREEEEECYDSCGNSPSAYANLLARLLFVNSLDLYFKDQDPRKRQWLHEAVDFRFPSSDKHAQIMKWKSCSYAINRNMKNPQPATKTYTTTPTVKVERSTPQTMPVSYSAASKFANQDFLSTRSAQPPLNYKYLPEQFEKDCLEKARGNAVRYTELMALRLFADSLDLFFKEQDIVRKEWLRMCVDRRFPIDDKVMKDQRWKVCAQACNKNRSKILDDEGNEAEFPYMDRDQEAECYESSNGVPYVYAELMARELFADSPHLLFKDQDEGRRHWLHRVVEQRFPTDDPVERMARWKSCTTAMNKKVTDVQTPKNASEKNEKKEEKKPQVTAPSTSSSRSATPARNDRRSVLENSTTTNHTSASSSTPAASSSSTVSTSTKRESARNKVKREAKEAYSEYPFMTEEEEMTVLDQSTGNVQVYAKNLAKILFKETLKLYYKDQDPEKRQWMREIVDFRFPTKTTAEYRQQWKNISAVVNKNMTSPSTTSSKKK